MKRIFPKHLDNIENFGTCIHKSPHIFSSIFAQDKFTNQNYFKEAVVDETIEEIEITKKEAVAAKMTEKEANEKVATLKAERKPKSFFIYYPYAQPKTRRNNSLDENCI